MHDEVLAIRHPYPENTESIPASPIKEITVPICRALIVTGIFVSLLLGLPSAQGACPPAHSKGITCETYAMPPASSLSDGRVVLFFMYNSPKSSPVHRVTKEWEKKLGGPRVFKVHVGWGGSDLGRVHFALQTHKLVHLLGQRLFDSIYDKTYKGPDDLIAWAAEEGFPIDARKFKETLVSKDAYDYLLATNSLAEKFQVEAVPMFAINGKYRVSVLDSKPETLAELETLLVALNAER